MAAFGRPKSDLPRDLSPTDVAKFDLSPMGPTLMTKMTRGR
jgi:hypothetical protein